MVSSSRYHHAGNGNHDDPNDEEYYQVQRGGDDPGTPRSFLEAEVKMIGCQMSIDLFDVKRKDFIDDIEIGGAATWMENAGNATVNLFI